MTMKTMKLALAAVAVLGVGAATAQEMGVAPATTNVAQDKGVATVSEQLDKDKGQETVNLAVAKAPELQKKDNEVTDKQQKVIAGTLPQSEFISAEQAVKDKLENVLHLDIGQAYNPERKSILVVKTVKLTIKDPASHKSFIDIRNVKATEAVLAAKSDIIKSISLDLESIDSAVTRLDDTDGETPGEKEFKATLEDFNKIRDELQENLVLLDQKEAEAFEGVTINDRFGAILDGIAKKLDSSYNPNEIDVKKIKARDDFKAQCDKLREKYEKLRDEAAKLPKLADNEVNQEITMHARMPLLGATVLTQSESWDPSTSEYQLSIAMVWSMKLQKQAKLIAKGDFTPAMKKGAYSIRDWMKQQKLESMVGPRRFVDDKGRTIYLGIAAADLTGPRSKQKGKKMFAETIATEFIAFSLVGDVETWREVKSHYAEYSDRLTEEESQKFSKSMLDKAFQKFKGNLRGCVPLSAFAKECPHPISGRTIYVVPYYLDPSLAKDAAEIMGQSYADAGVITKEFQRRQGIHAGQEQALQKVRESREEFIHGVQEGRKDVEQRISADAIPPHRPVQGPSQSLGPAMSMPKIVKPKSQGGTFNGDAAIDTDF